MSSAARLGRFKQDLERLRGPSSSARPRAEGRGREADNPAKYRRGAGKTFSGAPE